MHTKNRYAFETEAEAQDFYERQSNWKSSPMQDKYVTKPIFFDEDKTFKDIHSYVPTGRKYWTVSVEIYQ